MVGLARAHLRLGAVAQARQCGSLALTKATDVGYRLLAALARSVLTLVTEELSV